MDCLEEKCPVRSKIHIQNCFVIPFDTNRPLCIANAFIVVAIQTVISNYQFSLSISISLSLSPIGKMVCTPIKIISFNTYLISKYFNKNRETSPEQRGRAIGRYVIDQNPDLCFFQEVWGTGLSELTESLNDDSNNSNQNCNNQNDSDGKNTFQVPPSRSSMVPSSFGILAEMIHTLYFHLCQTGGLYDIVQKKSNNIGNGSSNNNCITCLYRSKHTFPISRSKSKKGVEATLWAIPQWQLKDDDNGNDNDNDGDTERIQTNTIVSSKFSSKSTLQNSSTLLSRTATLLVLNTHLDPWHPTNRSHQIQEITSFLEQTLQQIEETKSLKRIVHDWSHTGVLLVGDFNIKAQSKEYYSRFPLEQPPNDQDKENATAPLTNSTTFTTTTTMTWKDFFLEPSSSLSSPSNENSKIQSTYAMENPLVSYPEDCGRIDYIFGIEEFGQRYKFLPLKCIRNSIDSNTRPVLSDHYPLMVTLQPK